MTNKEKSVDQLAKEAIQAKHRLEEAEMRGRVKERKLRTRRLIQRGAILESIIPNAEAMTNEELQRYLYAHLMLS